MNSKAKIPTLPIHLQCGKITQEGQSENMRKTTLHKSSPCTSCSCSIPNPTHMHILTTFLCIQQPPIHPILIESEK